MVIVAGFQNIDERPAEPAATPENDMPCPVALCSRMANEPACASAAATINETEQMAVHARNF
ncbi:hypothetical protein GGR16_002670 [Chelatococcus caeni]|uniref:Uncharacterized protein n=1 Tax=Chelatococcus caeni TaxID=1348468 RepID=A0A840C3X0_9HYPH|nr:hypothetical protein [Chelatococcus caeni]